MASREQQGDGRKGGRLSLRLRDEDFVRDVHDYAKRHNTTTTALVEDFLAKLLEAERGIVKLEQG